LIHDVNFPVDEKRAASPLSIQTVHPLLPAGGMTGAGSGLGGSCFHGAAWAKVLVGTYGFRPVYFQAVRGDRIEALLPCMEVSGWLTGRRGVSLPFTDHCRPLGSGAAELQAVYAEALRHGKKRGWKSLECRGGGAGFEDVRPSISFYGHLLELGPDSDGLFAGFEGSVRRAIRKARNSGLTLDVSGEMSAVEDYYGLHCQTRRRHGLPPQPFRFFRELQRHVLGPGLGWVVSARWGGRSVASAIFLVHGEEAVYKFGASDAAGRERCANHLVMWHAMEWLAGRGVKRLDFGRSPEANEGLRRYKLGWGAEEERLNYSKYDFRSRRHVTDQDAAFGWHNRVFQRLPLGVARLAGELLYRHWA
jgi:hypothetical protein